MKQKLGRFYVTVGYDREQPTNRHYETGAWCKRCEIAYPKGTKRCERGCHMKIRNNPRTPKQRERRDQTVVRY